MRIKPRAKLGDQYFDKNLPVVRQRMYTAAIGLAGVLNQAFAE
jgi:hypothetical protein